MPIPFLLAGLGVAAGVIGAGGHISAKDTNEKAQRISEDAQYLYNSSKTSLERAQKNTEKALLKFGYSKKKILDFSMKQFLQSYEKIKNIEVLNSVGLDEISNFAIDREEAIQIRKMSDIYSSTISSGATGAAAGAVIALAASGSLPVITGGLSLAGSTLVMGEIGAAAGIAGSALSFGAAMTPLAAVAAPVVLFTGISASIKADENLEKAHTMYAEAEAASEKMKVSETLCRAIADRSDMFNDVLLELDGMFSECARMLEAVIQKKSGLFNKKSIKSDNLSEEELKLIAVTRSLAGAVKAIIDTPILSKNGNISAESEDIYNQITYKLPAFSEVVKEIESYDYNVKPKEKKQSKVSSSSNNNSNTGTPNVIRNFLVIVLGLLAAIVACGIYSMNKLIPSYTDTDSGRISEYIEESDISDQAIEKAARNFTVMDYPADKVVPIESVRDKIEKTQENMAVSDSEDYILPDSNSRYLTDGDLVELDKTVLRLARNEIYARHGRWFQSEDLNAYFSSKPWYYGYISAEEFDDSVMNEYEKANLDLIKSAESGKDGSLPATSNTYLEEYRRIVNQVYDRYGENLYYLYDIDQNGVPELIVQEGTCEADFENVVLAYNGVVQEIGRFSGGHNAIYGDPEEKALISVNGHMGYQVVTRVTIKGGALSEKITMEGYVDSVEDYYSTPYNVPCAYVNDLSLLN